LRSLRFSDAFDQGSRAETATAAHRDDRSLPIAALEFVQRLGDKPTTGRAERMTERDRTRRSD